MEVDVKSQGVYVFLNLITKVGAVHQIEKHSTLDEGIPVRVGISQGVVETVGIPVEVLGEVGHRGR